jgi:hypothetical protein
MKEGKNVGDITSSLKVAPMLSWVFAKSLFN